MNNEGRTVNRGGGGGNRPAHALKYAQDAFARHLIFASSPIFFPFQMYPIMQRTVTLSWKNVSVISPAGSDSWYSAVSVLAGSPQSTPSHSNHFSFTRF